MIIMAVALIKNYDDAKDEKDEVLLHRQVQSDGIRKHNMSK